VGADPQTPARAAERRDPGLDPLHRGVHHRTRRRHPGRRDPQGRRRTEPGRHPRGRHRLDRREHRPVAMVEEGLHARPSPPRSPRSHRAGERVPCGSVVAGLLTAIVTAHSAGVRDYPRFVGEGVEFGTVRRWMPRTRPRSYVCVSLASRLPHLVLDAVANTGVRSGLPENLAERQRICLGAASTGSSARTLHADTPVTRSTCSPPMSWRSSPISRSASGGDPVRRRCVERPTRPAGRARAARSRRPSGSCPAPPARLAAAPRR